MKFTSLIATIAVASAVQLPAYEAEVPMLAELEASADCEADCELETSADCRPYGGCGIARIGGCGLGCGGCGGCGFHFLKRGFQSEPLTSKILSGIQSLHFQGSSSGQRPSETHTDRQRPLQRLTETVRDSQRPTCHKLTETVRDRQ